MQRFTPRHLTEPAWLATTLCFATLLLAPQTLPAQQDPSAQTPRAKSSNQDPHRSSKSSTGQSAEEAGAKRTQKTFPSPQQAAAALYSAARNHDENALVAILGPDSKDMVVWIDDPQTRNSDMDSFAQKYGRMHRLVHEPDNETTLYVGAENWPLPIPIVEKNGQWHFDSAIGKREILFRRIGENEMEAIASLHALVDAENDFYSQSADSSGTPQYAGCFASAEGKHDGLYWLAGGDGTKAGECPIGQYLAEANYDQRDHKPLHGYYFRMLTAQGSKAPGGARDYMDNGKLTHGFAFIAFPAEYRSSGVQTFIVSEYGRVYERDLGPTTGQAAKSMKVYDPDSTWARVRRPAEEN